jgi:hypothetical protein
MTAKSPSPLAADLLTGANEIAAYVGWPLRRVQHLIAEQRLPIKRVGKIIVARKSQLDRLLTADESEVA